MQCREVLWVVSRHGGQANEQLCKVRHVKLRYGASINLGIYNASSSQRSPAGGQERAPPPPGQAVGLGFVVSTLTLPLRSAISYFHMR